MLQNIYELFKILKKKHYEFWQRKITVHNQTPDLGYADIFSVRNKT